MTLSSESINRLITLKSLLELGDLELVVVAAGRLEAAGDHPEIAGILAHLAAHRYAEAAAAVSRVLAEGARLTHWTDPEVMLLEAELEEVTAELAETEAELAELAHTIARFQAAHNEVLGSRIAQLLKLRMAWLERLVQSRSDRAPDLEEARRDYEEFAQDREAQREADARSQWRLSAEEQQELKRLFRQASKKCHPDLVPPEHHEAAARMFRELRAAYDAGDLHRVRELARRAAAGLFEATDARTDDDGRRKEKLRARIAGIREALEKARSHLQAARESATYRTMTEHEDWMAWFEIQGQALDQEIEQLAATLADPDDDRT